LSIDDIDKIRRVDPQKITFPTLQQLPTYFILPLSVSSLNYSQFQREKKKETKRGEREEREREENKISRLFSLSHFF